jgi:hypothetical protein
MEKQFEAEVIDFHDDLTGWFTGALAKTDEAFAALDDVIAADFTIISPRGTVDEGAAVMGFIKGAHGIQAGIDFSIRIENCRMRFADGGLCLGTYEEWQEREGVTTSRLSTVLFRLRPELRHGLEWVHLHETWNKGYAPEG